MPCMKRTFTGFAFAILVFIGAGWLAFPPSVAKTIPQTDDPRAAQQQAGEDIKQLLLTQTEAWNKGDLESFMAGYWHSPALTFFSGGDVATGWQAALERYQRRYQGTGKEMGRLEFQDLSIDLLSADAAVVTGRWRLTMSNGQTPHGLFTLIVKRAQGSWHIVHDHTSSADER